MQKDIISRIKKMKYFSYSSTLKIVSNLLLGLFSTTLQSYNNVALASALSSRLLQTKLNEVNQAQTNFTDLVNA